MIKSFIKLFSIILIVCILSGCSGRNVIDTVKEGTLNEYPDYSVSEIFKGNVLKQEWDSYEKDDLTHVTCSGVSSANEGGTLNIMFDFIVEEESFAFYGIEINGMKGNSYDFINTIETFVNVK